jgi:hypothetical protein
MGGIVEKAANGEKSEKDQIFYLKKENLTVRISDKPLVF